MDEQSRELGGRNNPRRRAQRERARHAASTPPSASGPLAGARRAADASVSGVVPGAETAPSAETTAAPSAETTAAASATGVSADGSADGAPAPETATESEGEAAADGQDAVAAQSAPRANRAVRPSARPAVKQPRWTRGKIAAASVGALFVVLAVALVCGFTWLRWFSADDASDFRGTWYLAGTSTPIIITEDRIHLTDDVSYKYTMDTGDKTIEFTFGNLAGSGRYRFSLDRNQLALVDGKFSGGDTLSSDIGWTIQALWENLRGAPLAPSEKAGKGVTLLSRTPTAQAPDPDATADGLDADGEGAGDDVQVIEDETLGDLPDPDGGDGTLGVPGDKPAEEAGGSDDPQAGGAGDADATGADSDGASGAADEGDEGEGATSRAGTDDAAAGDASSRSADRPDDPASAADQS